MSTTMLTKDLTKCKVTHNNCEFTISQLMDGDMIIEYGTEALWVLATYDHRTRNYHIQENIDDGEIIDIKDTFSLPDALSTMSWYIHSHKTK